MGTLSKITRRGFLIGSTAIAGGVAFGAYMIQTPHENPLVAGEGEAVFNPWVKISGEEITLITPHADIGQGVVHLQATLIAEELDLEHGQYKTEFGPPAPAYYNTAFAAEASEALAIVTPMSKAMAYNVVSAASKLMGVQGTGGSTSTTDSFDKLRTAGAVARETLKLAASKKFGTSIDSLKTEAGAVILPDGDRIPYTELAEAAARTKPVTEVTLRDPSEWRLIGKPKQRLDTIAKATGEQVYGIDLEVEGMVHASIRSNPRRTGMASFDASAAEGMRGVSKIVETSNGVAAIADNTWRAIQAVNAVEIDWEAADYPAEQADHWAKTAESFGNEELFNAEWRNDGDAASVEMTLEAEYKAPYVAHQPLEPLNAIALVTDDQIEIWSGHQMPRFLQQMAAGVIGYAPDQVIFHNQYSGGSFGHRLEFEHIKQVVEIANQMRGTPVKLTYSREEDFMQDFPRELEMMRAKGKAANGKIEAMDIEVAGIAVTHSQFARMGQAPAGADSQLSAGMWNAPYDVANFRLRDYLVHGLAPVSSWRSVGASVGGFFIEGFVDELIAEAGGDPLEARLAMMNDPVARAVLEEAKRMSNWQGNKPAPNVGRGVAHVQSFGVHVTEIVEVTATDAGIRLDNVWVVADTGTVVDPDNIVNHIQGGVIWGLGHAMNSEITFTDGIPDQTNYHAAEGLRLYQTPEIHVSVLENSDHVLGIGEPPVPPAAPALANAIFAATGTRLREMPFFNSIDFV